MLIKGVEVNVDFTDADIVERIDIGREKLLEETQKLKNSDVKPAEGIRQEFKIIKDFIDYVFGDGKSKEIFGEKNSLNDCLEAFEDIMKAKEEQEKSFYDKVSKYSPDRVER